MKVRVTLCWILAASILLAGCQPKISFTEITTEITQGYEHKRNMSKNEGVKILGKYLSARYPELDSYKYLTFNARYKVFHSIDENGYTLDRFYPVVDSSSSSVEYYATPVSPGVVKTTTSWHWAEDSSVRVMFANVNRITVRHTTVINPNPRTYDEVRLIYDNGESGDYWRLGRPDIPDPEILSALFALCPNVK